MAEYVAPDAAADSSSEDESVDNNWDIVDAFPSQILDVNRMDELKNLFFWSTVMDSIKNSKNDAIPVIPFNHVIYTKDKNRPIQRIDFRNLEKDRHLLWDRFDRLYDSALYRQARTGYQDVDWAILERRMTKDPRLNHRYPRTRTNKIDGLNRKGNADNRQSFVLRHIFLVKHHVTPGARSTGPDEIHLYQLYEVPLMIYLKFCGPAAADASFYACTRRHYRAYLMHPRKAYYVPPGTTYITMSLQKTCYAVLRVTTSAFEKFQAEFPQSTFSCAFDERNLFVAKSEDEIKQIVSQQGKRKRGRPTKSLDRLYWYRDPPPQQQQQQQQQQLALAPPPAAAAGEEEVSAAAASTSTTTVAADTTTTTDGEPSSKLVRQSSCDTLAAAVASIGEEPLPELDDQFLQSMLESNPEDVVTPELLNWLSDFNDDSMPVF